MLYLIKQSHTDLPLCHLPVAGCVCACVYTENAHRDREGGRCGLASRVLLCDHEIPMKTGQPHAMQVNNI